MQSRRAYSGNNSNSNYRGKTQVWRPGQGNAKATTGNAAPVVNAAPVADKWAKLRSVQSAKTLQIQAQADRLFKVKTDDRDHLRFRKAAQLIISAAPGDYSKVSLDLNSIANELKQHDNTGANYYFPTLDKDVKVKTYSDGGIGFAFKIQLTHNSQPNNVVELKGHVKFHPVKKVDPLNTDMSNLHIRIDHADNFAYDEEKVTIYFDNANGGLSKPRKNPEYEKFEEKHQAYDFSDKIEGMMRTLHYLIYTQNPLHDVQVDRGLRGEIIQVQPAKPGLFAASPKAKPKAVAPPVTPTVAQNTGIVKN